MGEGKEEWVTGKRSGYGEGVDEGKKEWMRGRKSG